MTETIFDCDNHYYEARDAFTRHVPDTMKRRCVQWAEVDGRMRHVVGGNVDYSVGNPLFDPVGPAGSLHDYYRGNPKGLPARELMRGNLEPQPACYRDSQARLAKMDEQGVDAVWLFPTLGILYEEPLKNDVEAVCALFEGFNRWLDEDWGLSREGRIFASPYISLADVDWACRELEWALTRDARTVVMRPAAPFTASGPRSPSADEFDPFWARVNEAGITVVIHTGSSGYSSNGYAGDGFSRASIGMSRRPSVKNLVLARSAHDFLFTLACDKLFERFSNLRVASIENGAGFLPDLFRNLDNAKERNPWHFAEDPEALFREHVYVSPFWEDDLAQVAEFMGEDRVLFGSDWPHMEGLTKPGDVFPLIADMTPSARAKFLCKNTAGLNVRNGV
jgi:hypothetical protein